MYLGSGTHQGSSTSAAGSVVSATACAWGSYVRRKHNGCQLGEGKGIHPKVPSIWRDGVRDEGHDLAGEALVAVLVGQGKGYGVGRMRDDGPIAPVPAVGSAMKGIGPVVFVGEDVVSLAVKVKGRVLDAIRISAWARQLMCGTSAL